jgi:hypothetical protein
MALVFWIFMIVWLALGIWGTRTYRDYYVVGTGAFIWILLAILGYSEFGFPGSR